MSVSILGVRHHGPGSARAVRAELERLRPDVILIEGPPEADALVALAPELEPPVALLAHVPGKASSAAFWPFAGFSPEWQAILYGTAAGIPIRFCDLPASHSLAEPEPEPEPVPGPDPASGSGPEPGSGPEVGPELSPSLSPGPGPDAEGLRVDPIGALAKAAGYDDPERWWEDVVEHRGDTPFEVIAEAMAAVREGHEPDEREARREAYMRKTLRTAIRQGYDRIAVVCGAWHVPALTAPLPPAKADDALLRGLPKVKAQLTWVPWTYGRLASWSGYGAGISSPGWYHHLFTAPDRPVERWLAGAAAVLRDEGLPVSSAHVIESVRLAHSLATLRGRPLAGLGEVTEAARAVLCEGDDLAVELIQRRMVVGDRLGHVSDGTPMVPLQRDLREQQRRLKLKPEALDREFGLDLRKPLDLDRSRLLHRLRLLGVEWGVLGQARGKGTFRETWTLQWRPEFDLALVEAAALGVTVASAAAQRARDHASAESVTLADLTGLVERCLLADLPEALPEVLAALSAKAALDTDVTHLMAALPAMVRAHRYGDVRGTSAEGLAVIVRSMLDRICVGLPVAVSGLDDEAAAALLSGVDAVHTAVALMSEESTGPSPEDPTSPREASAKSAPQKPTGSPPAEAAGQETPAEAAESRPEQGAVTSLEGPAGSPPEEPEQVVGREAPVVRQASPRSRWLVTLRGMSDRPDLHGLIEGRLTRILLDAGELDDADARMSRAMSRGHAPTRAASWIEGFLGGGGLLLVHDPRLLDLVDTWLTGLDGTQFIDVLPLLRRTFGSFAAPERRAIGERVRSAERSERAGEQDVDEQRAETAARTVLAILGRARIDGRDHG
ncbi:DUF5682 family protein [Nonomuraea sp. NEAU-A123]|uniref:DUF5682 family protein n=1 Tax=Nonomuraea sp. NEAU-A123 TaxID=2839649 RepID=UPI001BE4C285|nr:DUF5682 family protein [Nonomuraea sp. NEAU-A123]MBT2233820.1 hypothetical protein [Nonomuraea sp. NEAU-A123]